MSKAHDIICLEAEWLYNSLENRFNLKTEPLLNWLKEFHKVNVIYRQILNRSNLEYYLNYLNLKKYKSYKIVYIACHGNKSSLSLEGEGGDIDLEDLAHISGGFFNDRIVHFSSCSTLAVPEAVKEFKAITGAKLVTGYTKPVDAMKSAIADMALLNALMYINRNFGILKNKERSDFWKTYHSLLDELHFEVY